MKRENPITLLGNPLCDGVSADKGIDFPLILPLNETKEIVTLEQVELSVCYCNHSQSKD
jgi:hypothetical protein